MNRNSNKSSIVTTLVVALVCLVIITGSTFSLFTSESNVNIAVTSGNVDYKATINEVLKLYSMGDYMGDGKKVFENGGTADINTDKNGLDITNITPGDKVELTIDLVNKSTVKTAYRVIWTLDEKSTLTALKAYIKTVDENNDEILTPITSGTSQWIYRNGVTDAENGETFTTTVVIELPTTEVSVCLMATAIASL